MYTIYVDNNLIYSPTLIEDGYYAVRPQLKKELNLASTLEFGLPSGAVGYNSINKLKSIVKVYNDNVRVFRGRCLSDEQTMQKQKNIYCEGELGFLQDSVIRAYTFTGTVEQYFTFLINRHNSMVEAEKQFRVGVVDVGDDEDTITRASGSYLSTFDEINEQLINPLGGYIMPRYEIENGVEVEYLDYLSDSGGQNSQVIEFGENLLDFSQKLDGGEIFTVLIPLGASKGTKQGIERRLTIASVNSNRDYLEDATGIARFGRITKSMVWEDVKKARVLKSKGQRALASGANIIPQIELSAIDMHILNVNKDAIKLGEYNQVISVPHGVNAPFQCMRQTIDFENPEQSLYSFGVTPKTLTSINNLQNSKINAVINQVSDVLEDVEAIYDDVAEKAPLSSPEFTGTPTAPTASDDASNGQIANIEYVVNAINGRLSVSSVQRLPVTSAVNSSNLRYAKYGRVISVSGWLKCNTNPSAGAVLFTLPKPMHEITVTAYDQDAPNTVPAFTLRPSSGNMEFYKGSIAGHYINFGFTYITAED